MTTILPQPDGHAPDAGRRCTTPLATDRKPAVFARALGRGTRRAVAALTLACTSAGAIAQTPVPGAAGTSGSSDGPRERLSFAIPGSASIGFAPLAFARAAGFFADEGLDLDIVVLQGSGEILPQLSRGAIAASMITPDVLITSRQPGKPDFPVRFVYNVYRQSFWQITVLEDSPIRGIADLARRTVGVGALTFASVVQTKALLRRQGVDPASVNFVAVGSGGAALEALRTRRIDALNLFATSSAQLEANGVAIRRLAYPAEFERTSSHGLVFPERTITERPERVERIGRAWTKGVVGCQANPRGCLDAYWRAYPTQKPVNADASVVAVQLGLLKVVTDLMTAFADGEPRRYGAYGAHDWQVTIDSLRAGGELGDTPIAVDTLVTGAFVDAFNRFDVEEVRRRALAWQD